MLQLLADIGLWPMAGFLEIYLSVSMKAYNVIQVPKCVFIPNIFKFKQLLSFIVTDTIQYYLISVEPSPC